MRVHIALTLRSRYDRVPPRKGVRGYGDLASVDMGGWRATCYEPVTRVRGAHRLTPDRASGAGTPTSPTHCGFDRGYEWFPSSNGAYILGKTL